MDLTKRLDRPVVLVGLMGVGKSTVGRRLAKRLGLPFVDSDSAIEDAAGYHASGDLRALRRAGLSRWRAPVGGTADRWRGPSDRHWRRRIRRPSNARASERSRDHDLARCTRRDSRRSHRPAAIPGRSFVTAIRKPHWSGSPKSAGPPTHEAHIHVKSGDGAHGEVVDAIVEALEKHLSTATAPRPGRDLLAG